VGGGHSGQKYCTGTKLNLMKYIFLQINASFSELLPLFIDKIYNSSP